MLGEWVDVFGDRNLSIQMFLSGKNHNFQFKFQFEIDMDPTDQILFAKPNFDRKFPIFQRQIQANWLSGEDFCLQLSFVIPSTTIKDSMDSTMEPNPIFPKPQ